MHGLTNNTDLNFIQVKSEMQETSFAEIRSVVPEIIKQHDLREIRCVTQ